MVHYIINRKTGRKKKEHSDPLATFLVKVGLSTPIPHTVHKLFANQVTSRCKSYFEKEDKDGKLVKNFIKRFKIKAKEASKPIKQYKTVQEFFQRHLKKGLRKIASIHNPSVMVSPADCRMMVFENASLAHSLWIKGKNFTIERLLTSKTRANYYEGASIVLCRLAPQDYHRFHFPIGGKYTITKKIKGGYLSVQPHAINNKKNILTENKRTVTYLKTKEFGTVAIVAVGATCVGSIVITAKSNSKVKKGQEYGTFAFGGSTLVILIPKGKIYFDEDLVKNSYKKMETFIQMGEKIGMKTNSLTNK